MSDVKELAVKRRTEWQAIHQMHYLEEPFPVEFESLTNVDRVEIEIKLSLASRAMVLKKATAHGEGGSAILTRWNPEKRFARVAIEIREDVPAELGKLITDAVDKVDYGFQCELNARDLGFR